MKGTHAQVGSFLYPTDLNLGKQKWYRSKEVMDGKAGYVGGGYMFNKKWDNEVELFRGHKNYRH